MAGEITVARESSARTINAVRGVSSRTFAASSSRRTPYAALSGIENRANNLLYANARDYTRSVAQRERNADRINQAARNMSYRVITSSR